MASDEAGTDCGEIRAGDVAFCMEIEGREMTKITAAYLGCMSISLGGKNG